MKINTILFDLDGVLVDAKDWHFDALNRSLAQHGYKPLSYEDHLAHYDGLPTLKKLARLSQEQAIPPAQFEAISSLKQKITYEIAQEKCIPTPCHVDAVQRLKQEGYQMAVCSNSVRASVNLLLEKTGLLPFFSFTLSNEDVSAPKPEPEIYLSAMNRFSAQPGQTLILEDNINGIRAARASGGHVLEIINIGDVNYDTIKNAIARIEGQKP